MRSDHRGTFFSGEVEIHHECGILYHSVTATIGAAVIGDHTSATFPRASVDDNTSNDGKTVTVTFNNLRVGLKVVPNILINVTAISRCMGRTQKSFPMP